MIVEALVQIVAGLVAFIGDLMPNINVPGFLTDLAGLVGTVAAEMAPMGTWLPFGPAGNAVALVMVACGVAVVLKLVRIVASFFLGGGGGAA